MELRDRILDAAVQVYAETGFGGATTRRIAERAGVNEITLFRHFGSKDRLLQEAIKCVGVGESHCTLPDPPISPSLELRTWALAHHKEWYEHRNLIRVAMGEMTERPEMLPADRAPTFCAGASLYQYLERLREHGMIPKRIDIPAATMMFMGTLFADAVTRDLIPTVCQRSMVEMVDEYVALFLRALELKESAR